MPYTFSLSIRIKLWLIAGILLLPVALLATLFIQQSNKDIAFAQKERDGVTYLRGAWPTLKTLIMASNDAGLKPATALTNGSNLADLAAKFDIALDAKETSQSLADSLKVIGWPNATISRDAKSEQAIAVTRALITKVADGSNLTLDPDLDSFYVMDALTVRMPEAIDRLGTLYALALNYQKMTALDDDAKAEIAVQLAHFETMASGAQASIDAAYKNNADGALKRHLDIKARAFAAASDDFIKEVKSVIAALRVKTVTNKDVDLTKLAPLYISAMTTADTLWMTGSAELDRLLDVRVGSFVQRLWMMLTIAGALCLAALVLVFVIARGITGPLGRMNIALGALAAGNFNVNIPGLQRGDEVGAMARAISQFKIAAVEKAQHEAAEREAHERLMADARKGEMQKFADRFEATLGEIVTRVSSSASELKASAESLTQTAHNTGNRASNVAQIAAETTCNVQTVTAATEELSASIQEIARRAQESNQIADEAVQQVERANNRISELSGIALRVGDVVKLITAIAEQTNLLALNATIEAARAGEAGRGFAVVAQEVKALATQTAKATDEIATQIGAMQDATRDSVEAIGGITSTIDRISETSTTISAAVEEQGSATREIARNVQHVANGTNKVADNISEISGGAAETGSVSVQVLQSADTLKNDSSKLLAEFDQFIASVRAA